MSTLKTNNIQHVDRSEPSILIDTSGSVSIAGTLTYEDVTSVDSVGIITARGLNIFGNTTGLQVASGISTFQAVTGTTGTFSDNVQLNADTKFLQIGASQDLDLHHNGTNSFIRNKTGNLHIRPLVAEEGIILKPNGAVELYNDNTKRLSTTGNGADIFGSGASSAYLKLINTSATSNNSHQFTIDGYNADNTYWNKIQIDGSEVLLKTYTGTRATLTNTALTFASGVNIAMASGNGIDFSATGDGPSVGSELFDDYEEGSYTPVVSFSGTTYTYGASNDYTLRSPHSNANNSSIAYTKIGSMVFLNFTIFWNISVTARYVISLPFTARGSAYALCTTPASFQVDIDGDSLGTLGTGNNSTGFDTYRITKDTSNAGHGNIALTQHSEVYYQICYEAQ